MQVKTFYGLLRYSFWLTQDMGSPWFSYRIWNINTLEKTCVKNKVTKKHVCNGCNAVSIRAYCIRGFALSLMRFLCWVGTTYTYTLCLLFLELTFRFRFQAGWFLTFLHLHFCRNLKCHRFQVSPLSKNYLIILVISI